MRVATVGAAPQPGVGGGEQADRLQHRGGGGQKQNARIAERREKDILVGKITELYAAKGDDPPFGLASSDLATLRRHLERMRDRK